MSGTSTPRTQRRPWATTAAGRVRKRVIVLLGLGAVLVVGATLGVRAWQLWRAEPVYFTAHRAFLETSETELAELADHIEAAVLPEWSAPLPRGDRRMAGSGERTVTARYEQINAWLAVRLRRYLRNQGAALPDEVGAVMVTGRDGQLGFALDIDSDELQQVLSVFLDFVDGAALRDAGDPRAADGTYLKVDRVVGGRLRLPVATLVEQLRPRLGNRDAGVDAILDAIENDRPVGPIVLPVDGHRRARLLGVDVGEQELGVTIEVFDPDDAPSGQ